MEKLAPHQPEHAHTAEFHSAGRVIVVEAVNGKDQEIDVVRSQVSAEMDQAIADETAKIEEELGLE